MMQEQYIKNILHTLSEIEVQSNGSILLISASIVAILSNNDKQIEQGKKFISEFLDKMIESTEKAIEKLEAMIKDETIKSFELDPNNKMAMLEITNINLQPAKDAVERLNSAVKAAKILAGIAL